MICALIGTSKFSEVHLTELIRIGAKQLVIISRDISKSNEICKKYKSKYPKVKIYPSKIDILWKTKFDLIDICSSNYVHDKHLKYISGLKSIILVEKPIISLLKYQRNYKIFLNKLYKENKKVVVCYPMIFLSKEFKKIFKNETDVNNFKFYFSTGGRYNKEQICVDLMPHALSFLISFFKKLNFKKKINIKKIKVKKNSWSCYFTFQKINFYFDFFEKIEQKSLLTIELNDKKITRSTKKKKNKFINFLKYKNKNKTIKNPMTEFFQDLLKNKNNVNFFRRNKSLTLLLMKINYQFLFR